MKSYRSFKIPAVILFISVLLFSCKKEPEQTENKYLVSEEVALQFTKEYMRSMIDAATGIYPEVSELKPLITHDIKVYKIVYKTTINEEEIDASGLVCVPAVPGDYPVLSFQNGTNTLNASAPSMMPTDYSYQMIEIIASLGFIVVIPDYPGFGASSGIPHPYLIAGPTVVAVTDMFHAVEELTATVTSGITIENKYYLLGYSQGGWATLALHKALELDYKSDFNLAGSACGAGPYNIYLLLQEMIGAETYPMPVYLGYIVNAYSAYEQFTNTVADIFNEPYASSLSSLYDGMHSSSEINSQLTTSIPDLINPDFLAGFDNASGYSSVRQALIGNSISAWHSYKPLLLLHGANDTHVDPISTENIYGAMLEQGTSSDICRKVIIPGVDHGDGVVPAMVQGIMFLYELKSSR